MTGPSYRWSVSIACLVAWAFFLMLIANGSEEMNGELLRSIEDAMAVSLCIVLLADCIVQCSIIRICRKMIPCCPCFLIVKLCHDILYTSMSTCFQMADFLFGAVENHGSRGQRTFKKMLEVLRVLVFSKIGLEVIAAILLTPHKPLVPVSHRLAKATGKVQVSAVLRGHETLHCCMESEQVMGIRGVDSVPAGMVTVVLKDRVAGDSVHDMVAVLYDALPNGMQRQQAIQAPADSEGWFVYVPQEDAAELQTVWRSQMQAARKQIERQFKADGKPRRAPRLCFHVDKPSGQSAQSCSSGSSSSGPPASCSAGSVDSSIDASSGHDQDHVDEGSIDI